MKFQSKNESASIIAELEPEASAVFTAYEDLMTAEAQYAAVCKDMHDTDDMHSNCEMALESVKMFGVNAEYLAFFDKDGGLTEATGIHYASLEALGEVDIKNMQQQIEGSLEGILQTAGKAIVDGLKKFWEMIKNFFLRIFNVFALYKKGIVANKQYFKQMNSVQQDKFMNRTITALDAKGFEASLKFINDYPAAYKDAFKAMQNLMEHNLKDINAAKAPDEIRDQLIKEVGSKFGNISRGAVTMNKLFQLEFLVQKNAATIKDHGYSISKLDNMADQTIKAIDDKGAVVGSAQHTSDEIRQWNHAVFEKYNKDANAATKGYLHMSISVANMGIRYLVGDINKTFINVCKDIASSMYALTKAAKAECEASK